jgi:hypothetical protein
MNQLASPLSNVQMELLKLYSTNLPDKDLLELKSTLAKFYAERSIRLADKIWDERGLTNDDMNRWLNED